MSYYICDCCYDETHNPFYSKMSNGRTAVLCKECYYTVNEEWEEVEMEDELELESNSYYNKSGYRIQSQPLRTREMMEEENRKREEEEKRLEKERRLQKRQKAMKPIETLIGMKNLKPRIENWLIRMDGIELLKQKSNIEMATPTSHIILTGNPGVGKTILARKLANILYEAGFIQEDKILEVKAEDLIAKYVGHTAQQTKEKIEEAIGGVFFLDEAYRLSASFGSSDSRGDYGTEALETIMGYMERDDILFIFAGYEDKMQEFLDVNDGLRSRVKEYFRLKDYTLQELTQMGLNILQSRNYDVSQINEVFTNAIKINMQQGILKGNGRTVQQYVDKIIESHMIRLAHHEEIEQYELLLPEDIEKAFDKNEEDQAGLKETFNDAKRQINELVGMGQVKAEIEKIGNFQYIQQRRKNAGLKVEMKSHHMLFLGNPGTGKTTLARLVGQLFRGANVLTNGHFVEATKDMLTGKGDSIPKTVKSLVDKATGGILFIDEAYTLANDSRGKEALDALIPLMENRRDDFICILAGYEKDMKRLFKLNSGLASRIPYHFVFEDYTSEELIDIALSRITQEGYKLEEGVKEALQTVIEEAVELKQTDGNGRWVRNLFEQFIIAQSERLVQKENEEETLEAEDFITLNAQDIQHGYENMASLIVQDDTEDEDDEDEKVRGFQEFLTKAEKSLEKIKEMKKMDLA